jgi:YVTN family beta-propeller protein
MKSMTTTRLVAPWALVAVAAALTGCLTEGEDATRHREEATRHRDTRTGAQVTVAGVSLYPIPAAVAATCRATQERAEIPILCPRRMPRPVRDMAGSTALPPPVLTAFPWDGNGIDFSYSAESGRPRLDRPERFFHFVVVRQDQPLPPGTRADGLGGKPGLLARASSLGYASESYFANHWRFFWSEDDADYAATLHNFGPRTRPLLDWLIRDLRPARSLPAPTRDRPGVKTIDVPVPGPVSIALHEGQVWIAGQGDGVASASWLARLDAGTGWQVGERIRVSRGGASALLADAGGVWIGHRGTGLWRLGADSAEPLGGFGRPRETVGIASAAGSLWLLDFGDWPASWHRGEVLDAEGEHRVPVGRAPAAVAAAGGHLWVTNNLDDTITRIDPAAARAVSTIPVGDGPVGVAAGYGALWVANTEDDSVSRIDPVRGVTATIPVRRGPRGVAAGAGGIWVTGSLDDSVSRIDPRTNRVAETIAVGAGPTAVAVGEGAVWVANLHDGTVTRIAR